MAGKRKLHEVFAHMAGTGDLVCHPEGTHVYTGGADASIRVFSHADGGSFTLLEQLHNHHTLPIRALAISALGDALASSADDHLVQMFTIPPATSSAAAQPRFESTLYRSAGATLSLAFHPSGLYLAMGCADGAVRVVSTLDPSLPMRELKGHQGAVRYLAYDPAGDLLASIDQLGALMISKPNERSALLLEPWIPRIDVTKSAMMAKLAWSPDGEYLALPGKADVVVRSRADAWKRGGEERLFKGGHASEVSICDWSSNGRYLLSASVRRVVVWEAESGEVVSRVELDVGCVSVHWAVRENAVVMMDDNGYIKKWSDPVPDHMEPPFAHSDTAVQSAMDADDRRSGAVDTGTLDPFTTTNEEDDYGEEDGGKHKAGKKKEDTDDAGQRRKRLRRAGEVADNDEKAAGGADEDFDDDDMDDFIVDETGEGLYKDTDDDYLSRKARQALTQVEHGQAAFQPSSTPHDPVTERRYLAFNLTGSIVSKREATFNSLEIAFADSAQHKPVRLRDHYGFDMAALGEHGCVMASRWESVKKVSVVFYRAFDSWAANSDWTLHLPTPETALCVAVGAKFVAVATDRQLVRLVSYSGAQLSMWSTRGPIVSLIAHNNLLCTVYHSAALPPHQALHAHVMDVQHRRTLTDCPLPLSPGATLTWLGYSEKGLLLSMDSAGMLRALSEEWGGQWVPLLDVSKKGKDVYWPVGLIEDKLMCAVCKGGLKVPNTLNRPVLTAVELSIPFVFTATAEQEEQHARTALLQYQAHYHSHLTSAAALSAAPFRHKPSPREQAALDKLLIPLFTLAVKADQGHRAVDFASRLTLIKSVEICYTLANQYRRTALAGRVGLLMGARRKEKEEEKEREQHGAAQSIAGFMEKGERRAEEERKQRAERQRREEELLSKTKATLVADEDDDDGDEGETELTYTRRGKKRLKTVDRSDVQAERDQRATEDAREKDDAERRRAARAVERDEDDERVLVEDEVEVVEDPKANADFLSAFRQPKSAKADKKDKAKSRDEDADEEQPMDEDEEDANGDEHRDGGKGDARPPTKPPKSSHKEKGATAATERSAPKAKDKAKKKAASGKKVPHEERPKPKQSDDDKRRAQDDDTAEPVKSKGAEKENELEQERDSAAKNKPKPVNPFAKRTFA